MYFFYSFFQSFPSSFLYSLLPSEFLSSLSFFFTPSSHLLSFPSVFTHPPLSIPPLYWLFFPFPIVSFLLVVVHSNFLCEAPGGQRLLGAGPTGLVSNPCWCGALLQGTIAASAPSLSFCFPLTSFQPVFWLGCVDLFSVCRLITLVCI